jgi:hypothetical protein
MIIIEDYHNNNINQVFIYLGLGSCITDNRIPKVDILMDDKRITITGTEQEELEVCEFLRVNEITFKLE